MPVRAGSWQQKSREGSKPLRRDAVRDFWIFPTKAMWRIRRVATESRMQLECMIKKRKLRWYGHILRSSGMVKTILQGTVKGARRRWRQKIWENNIKEWTGMGFGDSLRAAEDREGWKGIVVTSSVVLRWPSKLRGRDAVGLHAHDVTVLYKSISITKYGMGWKQPWANQKPLIYRLYNNIYIPDT